MKKHALLTIIILLIVNCYGQESLKNNFRKHFLFYADSTLDVNDNNEKKAYYFPIIAYNINNKFMLGAAVLSNLTSPPRFEYLIMPLYSFGNQQLSGETYFEYHFKEPINGIQQISPFVSSKSYGISSTKNFYQLRTGVNFEIGGSSLSKEKHQAVKAYYTLASHFYNEGLYNHFVNIEYLRRNDREFNPYLLESKLNLHQDFALLSINLKQEFTYSKPRTGLKIRFFSGVFLFNNSNNGQFNLSLSGSSGINDYLYEETFVGRTEYDHKNFWTHQFIANEGGFTTYAPFSSNQWMSSLTLSSTLPINTPLELYFSIATFEGSKLFFEDGLAWETGLSINIIRDIAIIYLPFPKFTNNQINETNDLYTSRYIEKARFSLILNRSNLKKIVKGLNGFWGKKKSLKK